MTPETTISMSEVPFKDFLFKNKRNRTILWLAGAAIVIQFAIFKYFYPFASYIHGDSFSYIKAAYNNLDVSTYLIGYSRFLRLFSVFTKSDTILAAFQYLFIQTSILSLLYSIFYIYKPSKVLEFVLLFFMVFNPLFLHLANLISSDGIFLALSLFWFTLLLWILHRPSKWIILGNILILFIAFTVRYNALIYPFISAAVILLSRVPRRIKFAGIGIGITLCGLFIFYTMFQYKKITGEWQYSPFSGWQFANNAMYAYRYVDSNERKPVPEKFTVLDNMIRQYFDSTRDVKKYPVETLMASTAYMWSPNLSLYKYRDQLFKKKDSTANEFVKWASMGPFYKQYGLYIIKEYPFHFARYFIWYNALKYYAPPVEFLSTYNTGKNYVMPSAQNWFGYKEVKVSTRMKTNKVWMLSFYPILSGIMNVVMLCVLICYISLKGWKTRNNFRIGILMGGTVWLLNAGFTIFASSAALRFQSFPLLITIIFSSMLLDWLWHVANVKQEAKENDKTSVEELTYKAMA